MEVFALTRRLIDIESITPNEGEVGKFLEQTLTDLAQRHCGQVERMEVEPGRYNIFACFGKPRVVLSTHMDTVPPFLPSREDAEYIWGRGACDAKGIIAAMIEAAGRLAGLGVRDFGLLFVVGEERNSAGALHAAKEPRGTQFLINGEPTGNRLALGSKGALRYEIVAHGRMAHSAYPELGESAIEKLLNALERIRRLKLPSDPVLGPSTLNIGTIQGGRAPNVIPDRARAEIFVRVAGDVDWMRQAIQAAAQPDAEAREVLFIPAVRLSSLDGFATTVVAFTTDIPAFGGVWGKPFLIGPGDIHVAHTSEERIAKKELLEAVSLYQNLVERLLAESV
jgi:acetylornithine deacetylase